MKLNAYWANGVTATVMVQVDVSHVVNDLHQLEWEIEQRPRIVNVPQSLISLSRLQLIECPQQTMSLIEWERCR